MSQPTFQEDGAPIPGVGSARDHPPYVGPAVVMAVDDDEPGRLEVRLPGADEQRNATLAVPGMGRLRRGTRVLVTTGQGDGVWVIGLLDPSPRRLTTEDGVSTAVVRDRDGERIQVRGPDDELLLEYDPERKKTRLRVAEGDLELAAPNGDLTLASGKGVRVRGQTIDMVATRGIRVMVHDLATRALSALRLGRTGTRLTTPKVGIKAEKGRFQVERTRVSGQRIDTDVSVLRTSAERIETRADSVVQRFGSLCRRVAGLVQTRAGRLRSVVSGAWFARSRKADLRSKETFKVDGEQIHLG